MSLGQMSFCGHSGSLGSKGHFHQKCYCSFILHDLIMWLMIVNQLVLLYKSYGCQQRQGITLSHSTDCRSNETQIHVLGSLVTMGSLGAHKKRAGLVSFKRHTALVTLPAQRSRVLYSNRFFFFFFFFLLLLLLSAVNIAISQRPYVRLCSYLVRRTSLQTRTFDLTS